VTEGRVKLVAFDMEGCLTDDQTVWEIMHRKLGTWESHGLPYWNRYLTGGLEYDEFARMDVAAWAGAPAAMLQEAAGEVPLMAGCTETLSELSAAGVIVAIITNGLACVADRFRLDFGVEHIHANRVVTDGDRLTGEIEIRVPYAGKGQALNMLAAELGLSREQMASVGDSASDVAMFRASRIGVAFRPSHKSVAAAATHCLADGDLRALLPILLSD